MTQLTAKQFIETIFFDVPKDESPLVARPIHTGEYKGRYQQVRPSHASFKKFYKGRESSDWYFGIATVGETKTKTLKRRKQDIRAVYCVVLDDIGTKCDTPPVEPSWILESSKGNYQYGYLLSTPVENTTWFELFMAEIGKAGFADTGTLDCTRIMRVPGSKNVKEGRDGFLSVIQKWSPSVAYDLAELADLFGLDLPKERSVKHVKHASSAFCDVELPDMADPVFDWLQDQGMVRGKQGNGYYEIQCPWHDEHSDGRDEAGYKPLGLGDEPEYRLFKCHHSHDSDTLDFLDWVYEQSGLEFGAYDPVAVRASIDDLTKALGIEPPLAVEDDEWTPEYTWEQAVPIKEFKDTAVFGSGKNREVKPLVTASNLRSLMALHNVNVEFNVISRQRYLFDNGKVVDDEVLDGNIYSQLLLSEFSGPGAFNRVLPTALASRTTNRNPVKEWLESLQWDGEDRLTPLCKSIMGASEEAEIAKNIVVPCWLALCVRNALGENTGEGNVLIFSGMGGIGKTQFFLNLIPESLREYILTGANINPSNKDDVMEVCGKWIVELGELGATFKKADMEHLKAFITKDKDRYRVPYARNPVDFKRYTTFSATVNDSTFLADSTGGGYRRWWVVMVRAFDWSHKVDTAQLWAEVYAKYTSGALSHRLTSAEAALVEGEAISASLDVDDDLIVAFHKRWPLLSPEGYQANGILDKTLTEREIIDQLPDADIAASVGTLRKAYIKRLRAYLRTLSSQQCPSGKVRVDGKLYKIHTLSSRQYRWKLPIPVDAATNSTLLKAVENA